MSSNVSYDTLNISGFYHDLQKKNKLMSVTLHPSTILVSSEGKETWNSVTDGIGDGKSKVKYRNEPIATAILKEDFTVAIANNWTDFSGGDTINQMWGSVKPFAAYAKYAAENLRSMQSTVDEMEESGDSSLESTAVKFINSAVDSVLPYVDKSTDYLNRALVVQGSRFSYYSGTGTSFGNLSMKFVVFADWKDKTFKTVHDQLNEIYPYIIGKYVDWDEENSSNNLNTFLGWQKPPGGFEADVKNVDNFIQGTLLLKFGGYYSIPNLVIRDAQLVFSKQMVKNPLDPNTISPLSCDVQLSFQAATKFSDEMLRKFVNGAYTADDVKEIQGTLSKGIEEVKKKNQELVNKIRR